MKKGHIIYEEEDEEYQETDQEKHINKFQALIDLQYLVKDIYHEMNDNLNCIYPIFYLNYLIDNCNGDLDYNFDKIHFVSIELLKEIGIEFPLNKEQLNEKEIKIIIEKTVDEARHIIIVIYYEQWLEELTMEKHLLTECEICKKHFQKIKNIN